MSSLIKILGRNTSYLSRLENHGICLFMGAVPISSTPKPLRHISEYIIGWVSYFLLRRVTRVCHPLIKERLLNTARLKVDSHCVGSSGKRLIPSSHIQGLHAEFETERYIERWLTVASWRILRHLRPKPIGTQASYTPISIPKRYHNTLHKLHGTELNSWLSQFRPVSRLYRDLTGGKCQGSEKSWWIVDEESSSKPDSS